MAKPNNIESLRGIAEEIMKPTPTLLDNYRQQLDKVKQQQVNLERMIAFLETNPAIQEFQNMCMEAQRSA